MIGRPGGYLKLPEVEVQLGKTIFPNVFMIGDTICSGPGLEGVSHSAFALADVLTSRT